MPSWTDYTKKQQPSDNDLMMIEDVDANVNKRLEFSGLANWIVEKLKKNNVISGALKFKGSSAYASLPTNPEVNDYYYSPDGNGTDGAGYYAWNGTAWIFIGNNDKGVDSTFTVEGAAADSKAVGDKFAKVDSETASLKEDMSDVNRDVYMDVYNELYVEALLTYGYYINKNGVITENPSMAWSVSDYMDVSKASFMVYKGLTALGSENVNSAWYNSNKEIVSVFKQQTGENILQIPQNAKYVRFSIALGDSYDNKNFSCKSVVRTVKWEYYNYVNKFVGKNALVIGDSLTAALKWQLQLIRNLHMTIQTHALGGAGIKQIIDGATISGATLPPLSVEEVTDKDLIVFFGGTNNMHQAHGAVGDVYPANKTVCGEMQYAINKIFQLMKEANNLKCRVVCITPYCFGSTEWNDNALVKDGVGLADSIESIANYNGLPCFNAYNNSGINQFTWSVYTNNATAEDASGNKLDQLHLNDYGYAYLGDLITQFINTVA